MSLRFRLLATIALVLTITLVIGGVLTYWHAHGKVNVEMRAALSVGRNTVDRALEDVPLSANPSLHLIRLVNIFDGNRHLRVALVNAKGETLLSSQPLPPEDEVPMWFYRLVAQAPLEERVELPERFRPFGKIQLATDSLSEIGEVWEDLVLKLEILALFCALVLGLVYFILGAAMRPLATLSQAFKRLGEGDYTARASEIGPSEFAALARGFNQMALRLNEVQDHNRRLHDQLIAVQEEERADLARDLHDEVSPFLFSADVDANSIKRMAGRVEPAEIVERAQSILEAVAHMKRHVKAILGRLRPAVLLDASLDNAISSLVASYQARHPDVAFSVDLADGPWGAKHDALIHCLVREGLSNALQHGRPHRIEISLRSSDGEWLFVSIKDDGGGLRTTLARPGFGLVGMRERVSALGGKLTVQNRDDTAGVELGAWLPWPSLGNSAAAIPDRASPP